MRPISLKTDYKICTKCNKKRRKMSFPRDISKPDGYYPSCKDCYRARMGLKRRLPRHRKTRAGEVLRRCGNCNKYKHLRSFYKNVGHKDGIHTHCKTCAIKFATNKVSKLGQKGRRQREKMTVITHYGGNPPSCQCCGEKEYKFLAIDHIHGGGNRHRKSIGNSHFYRWVLKNGFPKGLQVLCHNCNMAKGFYGKCPHKEYEPNTKTVT